MNRGVMYQNFVPNGEESRMRNQDVERLLTVGDVERLVGVSWTTLRRWRKVGYGPPYLRLQGERGAIRYPKSKLTEWMHTDLKFADKRFQGGETNGNSKESNS